MSDLGVLFDNSGGFKITIAGGATVDWRRTAVAAGLAIIAALAAAGRVKAEEIKVVSTSGVKPALPEVVTEFERATGHKVSIVWGIAATLKSRYLEGEQADVAVLMGGGGCRTSGH